MKIEDRLRAEARRALEDGTPPLLEVEIPEAEALADHITECRAVVEEYTLPDGRRAPGVLWIENFLARLDAAGEGK